MDQLNVEMLKTTEEQIRHDCVNIDGILKSDATQAEKLDALIIAARKIIKSLEIAGLSLFESEEQSEVMAVGLALYFQLNGEQFVNSVLGERVNE